MKLLVITNMYPTVERPWAGTFVEQQVKGLQAIGVEVKVLYFDRKTQGPFVYYRMQPRIAEAMAEFRPDLIHVMYGGVMADKVTLRSWSRPVVITFHGSDLLGENLSGLFRKMVSHYGVLCSKKAARRASGVVVVARHLLKALPGFTLTPSPLPPHLSPPFVRVIPCGIDLERFKPMDQLECRRRLGWSADTFHVIFASGNHDPVKRPWLAKAAVEHAAKAGIPTTIHYLTGVPNLEVPVWLNASDALLLTSLHEGSPTVVKECLACGVPVVSVDVGDVAERIKGVAGCQLAAAEPADLALKLQMVYKSRQRLDCRSQIGALSYLAVANQLRDFYQDILTCLPLVSRSTPPSL